MVNSARHFVLVLMVAVQAIGGTWALAPMPAMTEQAMVEPMPCHDDGSATSEMSCCDDPDECRCIAGCVGVVAALVSRPTAFTGFATQPLATTPIVREPPPMPPDRLFRPPVVLLI